MTLPLAKLMHELDRLASMPVVVGRVLAELASPRGNARTIGRLIEDDPPLTARLLGIANSAFFAPVERISTAERAVSRLGMAEVRQIVLATSLLDVFGHGHGGMDITELYVQSIASAVLVSELGKLTHHPGIAKIGPSDGLFTLGLLHDIGLFALNHALPGPFAQCLDRSQTTLEPLAEAERFVLGYDHAAVGALLLQRWRLTPWEVEVARWHHKPDKAPADVRAIAELAHLADVLIVDLKLAPQLAHLIGTCSVQALDELGISVSQILELQSHAGEHVARARALAEIIANN